MIDFAEALKKQKQVWEEKPVLRKLYRTWYRDIISFIRDPKNGLHVEIGSGSGNFKEFFPRVIATDPVSNPWIDKVVTADEHLPFEKNSIDTLILIDVLHHLSQPLTFFEQANTVLKPGGRIILLEPYISPFSYFVYKWVHHEHTDTTVSIEELKRGNPNKENSAIPTLIFCTHGGYLQQEYSNLKIIHKQFRDFLIYPLTGGFSHISLIPAQLLMPLYQAERRFTQLLGRLIGLRLLVVLEKS